jgi:hypothetical protein
MSILVRLAALGAGSVAIAGLVAVGSPQAAYGATTATPATVASHASPPCGYDGRINGQPTYNHCGRGSVVIEVDHFFWQHTYACMPRGVHVIPQGNSSWAIIGAEFDGHSCAYTQPVPVVGP